MKRHNLFISSGPHCDKYYNFYGIKDEKIRHYHFSSLNEKDIIQNRKMINNKKEYRNLLNIDNKFTFISVGKPVKGKGFDILLKAYKESGLSEDANLLIIGGEPQDDTKEFVEKNKLNNVHFIGLLNGEELKKYYAASDAFILCTRTDVWGLVILESMSFGLPVITSNNCGAGVHFNLLTNNVRICDVEDYIEYGHVMQDVYKDNNLKNKSEEIFNVISEYTIENGCKDIIDILESI